MNKVRTRFYYYPLLIIMLSCLACGGKTDETETKSEPSDELQSFQIDLHEDKTPFVDLIESIEITRLEETEQSLLRYVAQVEFYEDKMIIPTNSNDGTIYIFSKKGEFISKFNRKGEGPEEYSRWTDIWLEDDLICIYVRGKSINRYDLEGNFISQDRLKEQAEHVHPYKSGYVLDMQRHYTQDSLKYSIVTIDDQMEIDQTLLPFDEGLGFRNPQFRNSFFTLGDDLFYLTTMSDTVYKVAPDVAKPYIHYNFGEDWYFKEGIERRAGFYEESSSKKQAWFVLNFVGKDHIYLFTTLGPRMDYSFLIDRVSNQTVNIDTRTSNGESLDLSWLGWHENEFFVALMPTQLVDIVNQLDQDQYDFTVGSSLEEIENSENPVLISIKFK